MRKQAQHLLRSIWEGGRVSRSQLREQTGLTPNGVGLVADELMRQGFVRECPPEIGAGAGRPRVPLEIDPTSRHIVGLAIGPGRVEMVRIGFGGVVVSKPQVREVSDPAKSIDAAAQLIASGITKQVVGVGVSVTGLVDPVDRAILFSSSQPGQRRVSLQPALAAAGSVPVVLENDMHALAARWLLGRRADDAGESVRQDVLLISVAEGRLGAAMMIHGRPNRGCVTGGNELGHNRFFVDTAPCYCGHVGCLERVVTTDFLFRRDREHKIKSQLDLASRLDAFATVPQPDPALADLLNYLACGIGNAINFVRPHRVVLINEIGRSVAFDNALRRSIRSWLLPEMVDRVELQIAAEPRVGSAESAGWLAIAELLHGGWGRVKQAGTIGKTSRAPRKAAAIA